MSRTHRAGMAVVIGALAIGATATAQAQIQGMPLFTNPRYATGLRVLADIGLPTSKTTSLGDYNVIQGGVSLAVWRLGISANVGVTRNDLKGVTHDSAGAGTKATASALAQLMVLGGGRSPWALSLFGGASLDVNGFSFANLSSLPTTVQDSIKSANPEVLTIPVGVALGLKLPLVIVNPNVWVAPRYTFTKIRNCPSCSTDSEFRWAAGVDVPILRILSVRAAFDSGKIKGPNGVQTVSAFGVGASIGIGGVR